jgi:hypothetical protein
LGEELTGHMEKALAYAEESYRMMRDHLGDSDKTVKKQEVYVKVLTARIAENSKLQHQLRTEGK